MTEDMDELLRQVRACRVCAADLPLGPRPVLRASASSRLLIIGQAPGTAVHASGVPWDDPSGERLRDWLQLEPSRFYDPAQVAIVPMGFCYPGRGRSGDLPPRPECAELWWRRLSDAMSEVRLTLLVGRYAQAYHLGDRVGRTLTDTVRDWHRYLPEHLPLPHPSPRNNLWLRRNPWFEAEVLPELRSRVHGVLS